MSFLDYEIDGLELYESDGTEYLTEAEEREFFGEKVEHRI